MCTSMSIDTSKPVLTFGVLMLDGTPCHYPRFPFYNGDIPTYGGEKEIRFGDSGSDPEFQTRWLNCGNFYVADSILLTHISWDDLNALDLVSGKIMEIDGHTCRIRIPTLEEWEKACSIFHDANDILHWDSLRHWLKDHYSFRNNLTLCCGATSPCSVKSSVPELRYSFVGFRPVLELDVVP